MQQAGGSFHQTATAVRAALGVGFNRLAAEWAGFVGYSSGIKCAEYFPSLPGKTCLDIPAALDAYRRAGWIEHTAVWALDGRTGLCLVKLGFIGDQLLLVGQLELVIL